MKPITTSGLDLYQGTLAFHQARELEKGFKQAMLSMEEPPAPSSGKGAKRKNKKLPLHSYFVLLFRTGFPQVQEAQVVKLCRMDRVYTEYLPTYDRIIEQNDWFDPLQLFLAHLKQFHGLRELYGFFPPGHAFWSTFQDCYLHTWKAVLRERLHHFCRVHPYPLSEFEYVAAGKVALYKVFSLALAHLSGDEKGERLLTRSLDQYHLGIYFLDDLQDWREDYACFNFTFPLTRLILENNLKEAVLSGNKPPLWKIGTLFYGTKIAEEQIQRAEGCFRKAMNLVKGFDLPHWVNVLEACIHRCQVMGHQLRQCVQEDSYTAGGGGPGSRNVRRKEEPEAYSRVTERPGARARAVPAEEAAKPEVALHPGVPEEDRSTCLSILQRCCKRIPAHEPARFYLGHWSQMPAHFLLAQPQGLIVGVNLKPGVGSAKPVSGRPLEAEVTQAYIEAVRFPHQGRIRSCAERLFVEGLGLTICRDLWPATSLREHAGMNLLEWKWCRKNEWLLWEAVKQRADRNPGILEHDFGAFALPGVPVPPAPEKAFRYLALRTVEKIREKKVDTDPVSLLKKTKAKKIIQDMERYCF